jgi:hypothetical protein
VAEAESIRADVLALLTELVGPEAADAAAGGGALLTTGVLDSLALVELADWIDAAVGQPVDPATVDLPREWDDVDAIVAFVVGARRGAPR